jgi:dTDP-glucose 4,6-dehydratase
MRQILITGGAGFIGSHVVRLFVQSFPHDHIINLDALTYAGNLENLKDIEDASNYTFVHADIRNLDEMRDLIKKYKVSHIVHLAAESHDSQILKDSIR